MSSKTIMYIHWLYKPYVVGGGETYLENLIEYQLKNSNNRIVLLTGKPFKTLKDLFPEKYIEEENFTIYRYYPLNIYFGGDTNNKAFILKVIWYFFNIWNIHQYWVTKKIIKLEQPDVIHLTSSHSGAIFSAIKKYKTILTVHAYELIPYPFLKSEKKNILVEIYIKIKKFQTQNIDMVIFPSNYLYKYHKKYHFFEKSNKSIIYNGVFRQSTKNIKDNYHSNKIVFIGQIEEFKGIKILIDWANEYVKKHNYKLYILGKGKLSNYVEENSHKNTHIIFKGFLEGSSKNRILASSKFLIIPSFFKENNPMSIIEAFSFGVPVIGSRSGGIPEIVKDDYTGYIMKTLDSHGIEAAVGRINNLNKLEFNKMRKNCINFSLKNSIENNFKKIFLLYEKL